MDNKSSNNTSPQEPNNKRPKVFKFSLYWLYSIIAFMLIALYVMNNNAVSKEVSWSEFDNIAKAGGIKEIVVYSNKEPRPVLLTVSHIVFLPKKINWVVKREYLPIFRRLMHLLML